MEGETVARTLGEGFRLFLETLTAVGGEAGVTQDQRENIRECLGDNFGLYAFFLSGAFLNGTSVRGCSSVDYFAAIGYDRIPDDSTSLLDRVGDALDKRFPNARVVVRFPAVVVSLGAEDSDIGSEKIITVIPAKLVGRTDGGHRVYEIADGAGGWMRASPDAHMPVSAPCRRTPGPRSR